MNAKKLVEVCEFISGLWTGKKPPYVSVGVIRNTNFHKNGSLDFSDIAQLDVEVKQFSTRQLRFGDIVLEKSGGGPKQPVGRVCVFEKEDGLYSLSNFTSAIRIKNPKELDYRYLHYYLKHLYIAGETEKIQTHSTGIRNLQLSLYKKFIVPLPSLTTQLKIVAKLDAIFAEIDKATADAEANAKNAEALFQSLLKRVIECDDDGWKEVLIGSLYKVASSKRVLKSDWKSEGVPFYRGREITSLSKFGHVENDLFITEKMYSEYSLKYGVPSADDIMVTAIGTIGNTYIVKNNDKFYFKDASVLWLKKVKDVDSKFVNYWFKSSHFTSQLDVGLGATVDTLTIGKVAGMRIKIPNLSTQKDVVAKLDAISLGITKSSKSYTGKANELENLKKSILRQAFTGELVKE